MKKIGDGWQYTTYDIGNSRVFKKRNSKFKTVLIITREMLTGKERIKIFNIFSYVKRSHLMAKKSAEILHKTTFPKRLMANPIIFGNLDYEQDKIIPLKKYIKENQGKLKDLANKFVILVNKMIENGFLEESFNIGDNYGIATNGEIVLIDLFELLPVSEKNRRISERPWTKKKVLRNIPKKHREEFIRILDEGF